MNSNKLLTELLEVYKQRLENGNSPEQACKFAGDFQFTNSIFKQTNSDLYLKLLFDEGFIERPYIAGFRLTDKAICLL